MNPKNPFNLSEEEIEELNKQADIDLDDGLLDKKPATSMDTLLPLTKKILLARWEAGNTHIAASELGESYKAAAVNLTSYRHLGDFLGNGRAGLRLASTINYNPKKKNKRYYKIPDPDRFSQWYEGDAKLLPREYYSIDEFRLVIAQLRKIERKNQKAEVSDVG